MKKIINRPARTMDRRALLKAGAGTAALWRPPNRIFRPVRSHRPPAPK